jgi:hypothetical protein
MADAGDSKSPAPCGRVGSTPTSGKLVDPILPSPALPSRGEGREIPPEPLASKLLSLSPSPGEGVLGWSGRGGRGVRASYS